MALVTLVPAAIAAWFSPSMLPSLPPGTPLAPARLAAAASSVPPIAIAFSSFPSPFPLSATVCHELNQLFELPSFHNGRRSGMMEVDSALCLLKKVVRHLDAQLIGRDHRP